MTGLLDTRDISVVGMSAPIVLPGSGDSHFSRPFEITGPLRAGAQEGGGLPVQSRVTDRGTLSDVTYRGQVHRAEPVIL